MSPLRQLSACPRCPPRPQRPQPLYLYALTSADTALPADARGIDGQLLHTVTVGTLAAVVSAASQARVRPERAKLLQHQSLLASLLRQGPVLPVAFGTVADDDQALVQLLTANLDALQREIERIGLHIEMSITGNFDEQRGGDIHASLAARDPVLQSHSQQIFGRPSAPARDELIALGMRFEQVLEQTRDSLTAAVVAGLGDLCVECKPLACHATSQWLNLACLVHRDDEAAFSQACDALASALDDDIALHVSGPWAPHSFVDFSIDAELAHVHR